MYNTATLYQLHIIIIRPFDDQQYKLMIGDETIERIGLGCKEKYFKGVEFLQQTLIF